MRGHMKGPAARFFPLLVPVLLPLLAALAGCSTNPVTGRNQFIVVSEQQAIGESAAAYNQMMGQLGRKKQVEADTERVRRVREMADRLIAQAVRFRPDSANWNWEIQVIDDPKNANAFCMAGGKMAVYSGLWEQVKVTDDELAQVVGHEIGHALANHTQERMSVAMGVGVGTSIAAIVLSSRQSDPSIASGLALTGIQFAALTAITLPNSREGEAEADQIGIELAARAGYDPAAAVTLWDKMGKLGGGKNPPQWLSTHPSPENRAAHLKTLGDQLRPLYLAAKEKREEAPSFLVAKEGANERVVNKAGEPTREEFAQRAANQAGTLTFLAEPFERFKSGKTVLDCRAQCAFAFGNRKADWRRLHDEGRWRDLAVSVLQVGYLSEHSYFMLGEAAKGLGLKDAAAVYYKRSQEAGKAFGRE